MCWRSTRFWTARGSRPAAARMAASWSTGSPGTRDRFKALISHAGVFDLTSKYGTTEELWFPEWEFGGTPWEKPEHYRERSPSSFVANFKTPTLVIHGALDFRVPEAQGLGMFTSLAAPGGAQPVRLVPRRGALDPPGPEPGRLVERGISPGWINI